MPVGVHKVDVANVQAQEAAALGAAADERTAESAKRVKEAEDQAKAIKEECAQLAKDNINLTRLLDASKVQVVQTNRKASLAFNHLLSTGPPRKELSMAVQGCRCQHASVCACEDKKNPSPKKTHRGHLCFLHIP